MWYVIKHLLVVFVLLNLGTTTCTKDNTMRQAIITGFDTRMCPCCGGLMLTFTNKTQPYEGEFYLVENSPDELGISGTTKFPVHLKVDYEILPKCSHTYVKIKRFSK